MALGDLNGDVRDPPDAELKGTTVSVVIPAKDEAHNLWQVLPQLARDDYEVILVDGNSTDDTIAMAQRLHPKIIVIGQTRRGKGNALACGFAVAQGDFIVTLDADGSADPAEIPRFVDALEKGADLAKGSRFLPGGGSNDISRVRRTGNSLLNRIFNLLYGTKYTDLCYGYNAFRRQCLSVIDLDWRNADGVDGATMLWGDGFEVETLINVRIAQAGLQVSEVPSFERRRGCGVSNLNAVSDGLRILRTIHAERRRASRLAVETPAVSQAIAGTSRFQRPAAPSSGPPMPI